MLFPFLTPPTPRADLRNRLQRLARVFPVEPIAAEAMAAEDVVAYYDQCFDAYRNHHSNEGAVHMALNEDGRFDEDGYYGPLRRLENLWGKTPPPGNVLEIGFGQGFNLGYLAPRFTDTQFRAIDLTPRHVRHVRAMLREHDIRNVQLRLGDFHEMPYRNASFDHMYCIEAFCYASDMRTAFAEQARVLRPGGTVTLFDGYLTRPLADLEGDEALAVRLVAKGMAMDGFQVIDELLALAAEAGLDMVVNDALDEQVLPNLYRLERLTGTVLRVPWIGRRLLGARPPMRGRNVLAGYLMRSAVTLGLLSYRQFTLKKRA